MAPCPFRKPAAPAMGSPIPGDMSGYEPRVDPVVETSPRHQDQSWRGDKFVLRVFDPLVGA
eukprot:10908149-Prorocentrum_lima.AAC.1